nr:MAG TPA: hypothetical protein [Bacteriophage sp.]
MKTNHPTKNESPRRQLNRILGTARGKDRSKARRRRQKK